MANTEFEETQIAGDGNRYKTDDVEKVNEELAADGKTKVKSPTYDDGTAVGRVDIITEAVDEEAPATREPATREAPGDEKKATVRRS